MRRSFGVLSVVALATGGCQALGLTGSGEGLSVERQYDVSPEQAMRAAVMTASTLGLRVDTRNIDALGGTLVAIRAGGEPVRITVHSLARKKSSVVVKADDITVASIVQEEIGKRLGVEQEPEATLQEDAEAEAPARTQARRPDDQPAPASERTEPQRIEGRYRGTMERIEAAVRESMQQAGLSIQDESRENGELTLESDRATAVVKQIQDAIVVILTGEDRALLEQIRNHLDQTLPKRTD